MSRSGRRPFDWTTQDPAGDLIGLPGAAWACHFWQSDSCGRVGPVHAAGRNKYGRTVARIEVKGQNIGHRLVAEGLAWHDTRYSDDATLAGAEARAARRGLWAEPEPVTLWDWRATEKDRKAEQREPVGR